MTLATIRNRLKRVKKAITSPHLNLLGKLFYSLHSLFGKKGIAFLLIISIFSSTFLYHIQDVSAATYTWNQSSWSEGADTETNPSHPTNVSGWAKYSTKDSNVTSVNGGADLELSVVASSTMQSDDGSTITGFNLSGKSFSNTEVLGTGSSASVELSSSTSSINNWDIPNPTIPELVYEGANMLRSATEDVVYVLPANNSTGFYKYTISTDTWTTLASVSGGVGVGSIIMRNATDDDIYVFPGNVSSNGQRFYKYTISTDTWTTLASVPGGVAGSVGRGGKAIRNGSDDYIYLLQGDGRTAFHRYSISGDSWTTLTSVPATVSSGGNMIRNSSDDTIYVLRGNSTSDFYSYSVTDNAWTALASTTGNINNGAMLRNGSDNDIYVLAGGGTGFYKYSISDNSWSSLTAVPGTVGNGAQMTRNGLDNDIYVLAGGDGVLFYKYSISGNSWTTLTSLPIGVGLGASMIRTGSEDTIYVMQGAKQNGFFAYSIAGNSWTGSFQSNIATAPASTGSGARMIRNETDDQIYALQGGSQTGFYVYSVSSNAWTTLTSVPANVTTGSHILRVGSSDDIYVLTGGGTGFYKYSISGNSWTTLTVVPGSVGAGSGMVMASDSNDIYVVRGNNTSSIYKYSISGDSWTTLTSAPGSISSGGRILRNGSDDDIYVLAGGVTTNFYKYSISGNSWTSLTSSPGAIYDGASLIRNGSDDEMYLIRGGGNVNFYKYSISGNSWTTLTSIAEPINTNSIIVRYGGSNDIYVMPGRSGSNLAGEGLYKYSISGNSWTTMKTIPMPLQNGSMVIMNSNNELYLLPGSSTYFYKFIISSTTYESSGIYTSGIIDLGKKIQSWGNLAWTQSGGQTISVKVRSSDNSSMTGATAFSSCVSISNGSALSSGNCVTSGHRYVQYEATLSTDSVSTTPLLDDVTINHNSYPSEETLTSSEYDTSDAANVLAGVAWTHTKPTGTTVNFQVRTSFDGSTYTSWTGPDGTSNTYFTDNTGGDSIPEALATGENDRWIQYKVFLGSEGDTTPTLSDVTLTYVVNASPEFNPDYPTVGASGVGAYQNSDGTVTINYSVRDADTTSGSVTPGFVVPSFEYSLNNGSSWSSITTDYLSTNALAQKAVEEVNYTNYSATWTLTNQIPNEYTTTAKIRVTLTDGEAANNTAVASSSAFTIDTTAPDFTSANLLVDASQSPAVLTLSAADDSSMEVRYGKVSDLSDSSYESYAATKTLSISSGDTVYAQVRDVYGNATSIVSRTPISAPSNMFYQDTSNPDTVDYRLFLAWGVVENPSDGFQRYNIYRSVNGGAYSLLTTITNRLINYYVDTGLTENVQYSYKVNVEDLSGNISYFSSIVSDTIDGVGGSDLASPTLSSVTSANINTTEATITWTTNKLADSTVYYIATTTYPGSDKSLYTNSTGVPSMVTSHSVALSGLNAGTQYYFLVESSDVSDNVGDSANSAYTFTTGEGPEISNVTESEIADTEATITWNTNISANSIVVLSQNSDMSSPNEITGSEALVTRHSVNLTDLTYGAKYYYYVKSTDVDNNTAIDKNVVNGVVSYYTFTTTHDEVAPIISDVTTSLIGETGVAIDWSTDEPTTSQVEWGLTSSLGTLTTATTVHTPSHSVVLNNLSPNTTYYYRVLSVDQGENSTTGTNNGSPYTFTTRSPSVVTETVTVRTGSGSRTKTIDNRDLTKPEVLNVQLEQVGPDTVSITFSTSKISSGVVEFGTSELYGRTAGSSDQYRTTHRIILSNLTPSTFYNYRVKATDIYENIGYSDNLTFTTLKAGSELLGLVQYEGTEISEIGVDELSDDELALSTKIQEASNILKKTLLRSLLKDNSLAQATDSSFITLISDFASRAVSPPVVSGTDISVEVSAKTAIVRWVTDKPSNSFVAFAKAAEYRAGSASPYTITAGNPDENVLRHEVKLENLEPNTTYHYQIRSRYKIGQMTLSEDRTFTTGSLVPKIENIEFASIAEDSVTLNWKTDIPTKTVVEIKNTGTGEIIKHEEEGYLKEHKVTVEDLEFATSYTVNLKANDGDGNLSQSPVLPFSTVVSREAPKISGVRITTSLIPERVETAQTIISWKTDKPSTSKVLFTEGTSDNFSKSTSVNSTLTRDHIVVTTLLNLATVYKIKVESVDSSGNVTVSDPYTVLTPKPQGSVVDLIFLNLDKTFGVFK